MRKRPWWWNCTLLPGDIEVELDGSPCELDSESQYMCELGPIARLVLGKIFSGLT